MRFVSRPGNYIKTAVQSSLGSGQPMENIVLCHPEGEPLGDILSIELVEEKEPAPKQEKINANAEQPNPYPPTIEGLLK